MTGGFLALAHTVIGVGDKTPLHFKISVVLAICEDDHYRSR